VTIDDVPARYHLLGRTGLRVSPLALDAMTFGDGGWHAGAGTARSIFTRYVEAGGNFIDTAGAYRGRGERGTAGHVHEGDRHPGPAGGRDQVHCREYAWRPEFRRQRAQEHAGLAGGLAAPATGPRPTWTTEPSAPKTYSASSKTASSPAATRSARPVRDRGTGAAALYRPRLRDRWLRRRKYAPDVLGATDVYASISNQCSPSRPGRRPVSGHHAGPPGPASRSHRLRRARPRRVRPRRPGRISYDAEHSDRFTGAGRRGDQRAGRLGAGVSARIRCGRPGLPW
jgi:hypothetical protein